MAAELPPDEPSDLEVLPPEVEDRTDLDDDFDDEDLDYEDLPCTDDIDSSQEEEDARWDVFIPDEDEWDPQPDPGDFWMENAIKDGEARRQGDKDRKPMLCRPIVS